MACFSTAGESAAQIEISPSDLNLAVGASGRENPPFDAPQTVSLLPPPPPQPEPLPDFLPFSESNSLETGRDRFPPADADAAPPLISAPLFNFPVEAESVDLLR